MTVAAPLVLVLVGTDHHPFDRLVGWVDEWVSPGPSRVVVQHGTSAPPRRYEGQAVLPKPALDAYLASAVAVVCHGGPATISEVRAAGLLPVVVPRDPSRGEHVDDHQQRFVRRMAQVGYVSACETRDEFHAALTAAYNPMTAAGFEARQSARVDAAVDAVGEVVTELVGGGRRALSSLAVTALRRGRVNAKCPTS